MAQENYSLRQDRKFIEGTVILTAMLITVILFNIQTSGLTVEQWLYNQLIRFSYLLLITGVCFTTSIVITFKHSRFSEDSFNEKFERTGILTVMFTVCGCMLVYSFKYVVLPKLVITSVPSLSLVVPQSMIYYVFFLVCIAVLGIRPLATYQLQSVATNCVIYQRRFPLPGFLQAFEPLFNIVLFFICGDRFLALQAIEITRLPRETMRYQQRPFLPQEELQTTSARKYEHEDISAYLKKCQQGTQELYINKNGTVRVRRYVFGISRRRSKAVEEAEVALIRMKGGLESLSFELDDAVISEGELLKSTQLPNVKGYAHDHSVLRVEKHHDKTSHFETNYVSIVLIEGLPEHNAYGQMTQHDRLIRHCLNLKADVNFVTSFKQSKMTREKRERRNDTRENDRRARKNRYNDEKRKDLLEYNAGISSGFAKVSTHVIILAKDEDLCRRTALDVENSINTIYSGIHYSVETSVLSGRKLTRAYKRTALKLSTGKETSMSVFQLSPFTHLPEKPILGIESEYIPEFEIPCETPMVEDGVEIGRVVRGEKVLQPLTLKIEDLRRSMTILGMIGTGKTCLSKNIILELMRKSPEINWIVFDYKSEYADLGQTYDDILVLTPGSELTPLQINLFDPCDIPPEDHADRVFSLIREVYSTMFQQDIDLSVQMERVLKDVLESYIQDSTARVNGFTGFLQALEEYGVTNKEKFSNLDKTVTALNNRLRTFLRGALKDVFDVNNSNISFEELIHKKVIVDLGHIQSRRVPKEDVRFLMNFLVRLYGDFAIRRGLQPRLRNLIIVEECQFLVPELYRKQTSIDATPTEDLSILLRAYGVGFFFIGTRPIFAENSLANSYTIVTFQLTKDAEELQNYMNLEDRQVRYLKRMRRQECLVFSPRLRYPTRVRVNTLEDHSLTYATRPMKTHTDSTDSQRNDMLGVTDQTKELATTVKNIFCKECPLEGGREFCQTFRNTAWEHKQRIDASHFLVQCCMDLSDPENLLNGFNELDIHARIKYCLLRYLFSDYRVLSEMDWSATQFEKVARALKLKILRDDTPSLTHSEKPILTPNSEMVTRPQPLFSLPQNIFKILQTDYDSEKLPFDHCDLCPSQCDYRAHLGRILVTKFFDVDEFTNFVAANDTRQALMTCVKTADLYFQKITNIDELGELRADLFGFCIFCAAMYATSKRENMEDHDSRYYVRSRAQEAIRILRSIP